MQSKCAECRYFNGLSDATSINVIGECHRYAPQPLVGGSGTGWAEWHWPKVTKEDFCGEFQYELLAKK